MMMTKEEIILAFDAIWFEANNSANLAGEDLQKEHDLIIKFINEHFEFAEEYKSCRQELDGYYELLYPDPYKFEELKEGMWVWDDRDKECKIVLKAYITDDEDDVFVPDVKIVRFGYKYQWNDAFFEANRFFPITKANQ